MVEIQLYNPFNTKNRMFTHEDIHTILNSNYEIKDLNIFQNAMVHSSYVRRLEYTTPQGDITELAPKPNNCLDLFPESYERLEHLGDSVLGCCVATYLSKRFPTQQEGFLTNLRKELVCNSMLGTLAIQLKLKSSRPFLKLISPRLCLPTQIWQCYAASLKSCPRGIPAKPRTIQPITKLKIQKPPMK